MTIFLEKLCVGMVVFEYNTSVPELLVSIW